MRILSIDGAYSAAVQIRMLRYIELSHPGFLARTELIAGSSDSCIVGLCLANGMARAFREGREPGLAEIDDALALSNKLIPAMRASFVDVLKALVGFWPLLSGTLCDPENKMSKIVSDAFGTATLADLPSDHVKVLMISFDLATRRPALFRNFEPIESNLDLRLSTIALSSSSAPLLVPLQGSLMQTFASPLSSTATPGDTPPGPSFFLDGSLSANNPTMSAVASAAEHCQIEDGAKAPTGSYIDRQTVLSLGSTMSHEEGNDHVILALDPEQETLVGRIIGPMFAKAQVRLGPRLRSGAQRGAGPALAWGWIQWLFNDQFDLIDLLLFGWFQNSVDLAAIQCRQLLTRKQYTRYGPHVPGFQYFMRLLFGNSEKLMKTLDTQAAILSGSERFKSILDWVGSNWMVDAANETTSTEPGPLAPEAQNG